MGSSHLQLLTQRSRGYHTYNYFGGNTMKGFILTTIFMAAILANNGVANSKKLVVTYLGTDFILPGGCPVLKTGGLSEQQKRQRTFNQCMKTKALKQGCFTDKL